MRVLVTGASGFIGRHVVSEALARGLDVVPCRSGKSFSADKVTGYVECDLLKPGAGAELCREVRPTHLLHLAWGLPPTAYWSSPDNIRWLTASLDLFDSFMACGGVRIVGLGTCAEYHSTSSPRHEAFTPALPITVYGQAKLALCHGGQALAAAHESSFAWARLFYPFGPGDASHRLIPSACRAFLEGREFRTAASERIFDFIDVRDAARMLVDLLISDFTGIINIAGGKGLKAFDLLSTLARMAGASHVLKCDSVEPLEGPIIADNTLWRNTFGLPELKPLELSLQDCLNSVALQLQA